jgi:hypothetical protein
MRTRSARVALFGVVAAIGCGGGSSGPSSSTPSAVAEGQGTFSLQGAGYQNVTNSYSNAGGNHVFCRRESPFPDTLWVRLASTSTQDGDAGPHIDIDLCKFAGTATYQAVHDVNQPRTCSQGQSFGIWWHDADKTYVSRADSSPCTVSVTQGSGFLEGSFQCRGLTPYSGTGPTLDIPAGSFRCAF